MNHQAAICHAQETLKARGGLYIPFASHELFSAIAARWSVTLCRPVAPHEVAICLIDMKLARLQHTADQAAQDDSVVDIIGYAAIVAELLEATR
jgi:hypothetical protein